MASSINASTSGAGGVITTADNTGILNLQTASTNAVTIDASQNVGIGTSSPSSKFHVNTSSTSDGISIGQGGTVYTLINSAGVDTNIIATNSLTLKATGANIQTFYTNGSERMRIDSSGNVNIGQSSAFASSIRTTIKAADTSSQSLALVSAVTSGTGTLQYLVDGSNDVCGYIGINATANTTSYNTSSDYRLKENIVPMTGALDKVSQLKPVFWNWKHAPEIIGQGFIAHELAEVIPDAVSGEKDAVDGEGKPVYQGVDTSFLVATLTAAIQEQQTIINDLKARVTALEAK